MRWRKAMTTVTTMSVATAATMLLGIGTATAAPSKVGRMGMPCGPAAKACLSLSRQQAWLADRGNPTYGPVPVTTGRRGFETPPGIFRVTFKSKNHWSTDYNAPMPNSVFFNGGIAFHEGSLRVKSHGCVHLSRAAALRFFNTLRPGDIVQVVR